MNYEELIDLIVAKLKDKKEKEYPNSVMIVGVEGICCSGTSTLVNKLKEKGAEGVIFGCTEISLLINQSDCSIKVFDTTIIHSKSAVDFALSDEMEKSNFNN